MNNICKIFIIFISILFLNSCKNYPFIQKAADKKGICPVININSAIKSKEDDFCDGNYNYKPLVDKDRSGNAMIKNNSKQVDCDERYIAPSPQYKENRKFYITTDIAGHKQSPPNQNNLEEWLNAFLPQKENMEIRGTGDRQSFPILEDREFNPNYELSSSCLSVPITKIAASEADEKPGKMPKEIPSKMHKNNRYKNQSMGTALPTSLLELSKELIIKVDNFNADIIEDNREKGVPLEEILNKIGFGALTENNPVEEIVKLDDLTLYVLYKVIFAYPLNPADYERIETDVLYYEPNYYLEDLAMEANTFGDDILDQLRAEDWYEWAIGLDIDAVNSEQWGRDVVVAVIDTGVDYTCRGLSDSIWTNCDEIPDNGIDDDKNGYIDDRYGWNFVDNDNDPMDYDGHGTHVSGIINAVASACRIMPVKAFTRDGGKIIDIYRAIKYAVDNGAKVINLSWGGEVKSELINEAVDYGYDHGCTIIAASGNAAGDMPFFPAGYHKVISVSAGNAYWNRTYFTNRGDIIAPGKDILSYTAGTGVEKEYKSGTSMAAPFVSGVAAGLLSVYPDLHPMEILYNLRVQANRHGFLNAFILWRAGEFFKRYMCRIINAEIVNGNAEITAAASGDAEFYTLDYAEGINPGDNAGWENIANIHKSYITENEKILLNIRNLRDGLYTIRLMGVLPDGNCREADIDRITIEIRNNEADDRDAGCFFWSPFCKIDNRYNSYIRIITKGGSALKITPVFYGMDGKEVYSDLTGVIFGDENFEMDLTRYLPDSIKEYNGPVGIEVSGGIENAAISIVVLNKDDYSYSLTGNFINHMDYSLSGKNLLEASWAPVLPAKDERERLQKLFDECYGKNNTMLDMPGFREENRLYLYNCTDDDAFVNITFYSDIFDAGYRISDRWYWSNSEYDFYKSDVNDYERSLAAYDKGAGSISHIYSEGYLASKHSCVSEVDITWRYEPTQEELFTYNFLKYLFPFDYSLVIKLTGGMNYDGTRDIAWCSLILCGDIKIPARSFVVIPTQVFLKGEDTPVDFYCANASIVTNVYPKGSVYGAVVRESDGKVQKVTALSPKE